MLEGILSAEFWVSDPASIIVVCCDSSINAFLVCAGPAWRSFSLCSYGESDWGAAGRVSLVSLVDLRVPDNP